MEECTSKVCAKVKSVTRTTSAKKKSFVRLSRTNWKTPLRAARFCFFLCTNKQKTLNNSVKSLKRETTVDRYTHAAHLLPHMVTVSLLSQSLFFASHTLVPPRRRRSSQDQPPPPRIHASFCRNLFFSFWRIDNFLPRSPSSLSLRVQDFL